MSLSNQGIERCLARAAVKFIHEQGELHRNFGANVKRMAAAMAADSAHTLGILTFSRFSGKLHESITQPFRVECALLCIVNLIFFRSGRRGPPGGAGAAPGVPGRLQGEVGVVRQVLRPLGQGRQSQVAGWCRESRYDMGSIMMRVTIDLQR